MVAAAISKNRHILTTVGPVATKFFTLAQFDPLDLPTAATSVQPICAVMNFSTDSLQRVGCCTSVIYFYF